MSLLAWESLMQQEDVCLYVACALTHTSESFRQGIEAFKNKLRQRGYIVLDFVGLEGGTDADVYRHDSDCTHSCHLLVAICDHEAIGLGMEIGRRVERGLPTLLAAHRHVRKVTRMVTGAAAVEDFVRFERFDDLGHLVEIVDEHVVTLGLGIQTVLDLQTAV